MRSGPYTPDERRVIVAARDYLRARENADERRERLRAVLLARLDDGWTQTELAALVGWHRQQLARFVKGSNR